MIEHFDGHTAETLAQELHARLSEQEVVVFEGASKSGKTVQLVQFVRTTQHPPILCYLIRISGVAKNAGDQYPALTCDEFLRELKK